jgi:hypothetical protein
MRRLALVVLAGMVLAIPSSSQEKKRDPDPLMVAKLQESQALLAGLALGDFDKIKKSADALNKLSTEAQFKKARQTPEYELHANAFQRSAEMIASKAKAKNLDGATLAYLDLTLTCVRCHQYTREVRIGQLPQPALGDGLGR